MTRRRCRQQEIATTLRKAEILLARGIGVQEVVRELGIPEATYYRWRKRYGRGGSNQMRRLKEVEKESSRIRMQYPT